MSVIYIVLPLALLVVGAGIAAYVWAARTGQFDDTTTPPVRTVIEDDDVPPAKEPAMDPKAPKSPRA